MPGSTPAEIFHFSGQTHTHSMSTHERDESSALKGVHTRRHTVHVGLSLMMNGNRTRYYSSELLTLVKLWRSPRNAIP